MTEERADSSGQPGGASSAPIDADLLVPAPLVEDVLACSFPKWYPTFKRHTARSEVIQLPQVRHAVSGRGVCVLHLIRAIFVAGVC